MNSQTTFRDLLDSSRPLRGTALTRLSGLDGDAAPMLASVLKEMPNDRRLQLAQNLIDLAEDDATLNFDRVCTLLLGDPDPRVRRLAIDGLWENEDRLLIEPLVRMFNDDPDPAVQGAAALALGRFVLLNELGSVRPRDADRVITALRAAAEDETAPAEVRARAIEAAGAASVPWVREMIWRAYDAGEPVLQLSAIHAMGRNGDSAWLETLHEEMQSEDPQRRFEAAHATGEIGDEGAVPALASLIFDTDAEVQESAIAALGEIGGDLAITALRDHLHGSEPRVAEAIRAAIAEAQAAEGLADAAEFTAFTALDGDDDE
jgi:HEAT repeat protein